MAKVLNSISLDAPTSPVTANANDTFAFTGTPSFTGTGGVQRYDFKWEVDDGGGYVTIAASGTGLITSGTNPVINTNSQAAQSITVTCDQAGSYTIRMAGAPTSGGSYTVLSSTQTVTVSAGAITGTGVLAAAVSTISGSGASLSAGTGTLADQPATVTGAGVSLSTGTGALQAQNSGVSGADESEVVGDGALLSSSVTVTASGITTSTGTGVLSGQASTLSGSGASASVASGVLSVQQVTVSGSGVSASTGTGDILPEDSSVTGGSQNPIKFKVWDGDVWRLVQ